MIRLVIVCLSVMCATCSMSMSMCNRNSQSTGISTCRKLIFVCFVPLLHVSCCVLCSITCLLRQCCVVSGLQKLGICLAQCPRPNVCVPPLHMHHRVRCHPFVCRELSPCHVLLHRLHSSCVCCNTQLFICLSIY